MINAINSPQVANLTSPAFFQLTAMRQLTNSAFSQIKKPVSSATINLKSTFDFQVLLQPLNLIEGGVWTGFWGVSVLFSGMSLYELYHSFIVEHPAAEKFAKIGLAVKAAFVDLVSLVGATAYNLNWAHNVKFFSLGSYALLIKGLGYGASLITNTIEGGWSAYNVYAEKEAILKETSPLEKEKHKQRLCLSLIKVIGNISMVAWTSLGMIAITTNFILNPIVMGTLLVTSCVFSFTAYFYQRQIENSPLS